MTWLQGYMEMRLRTDKSYILDRIILLVYSKLLYFRGFGTKNRDFPLQLYNKVSIFAHIKDDF